MIAHQVAKDAAEGRELPQRFERLIGIGCEQRPQDRLAAFHAVFGAQISDRIAGDQLLLHQEVEESIDDTGAVQKR